jgi:hypothetical protein
MVLTELDYYVSDMKNANIGTNQNIAKNTAVSIIMNLIRLKIIQFIQENELGIFSNDQKMLIKQLMKFHNTLGEKYMSDYQPLELKGKFK